MFGGADIPAPISRNSVVIIGAGLVGGAVLRQLVLGWAYGLRERINVPGDSRYRTPFLRKLETIHITARSKAKLVRQLQKTKDSLIGESEIRVEEANALELIVYVRKQKLRIKAEILDILPEDLTAHTIDDEQFRKASSFYSYLTKRRPEILIFGVNLASVASYSMKEIQNLVLAWVLITLKQAADEFGIETVAITGTTALGGMGTNMVWTHQSSQQLDSGLVNKILAAYGILGIVDRVHLDSDSSTRWIFLTPGSLLGYDYLDSGPVKYLSLPAGLPDEVEKAVRSNFLNIPLYEPVEIDPAFLSDEQIQWEEGRIKGAFLSGPKIKCGESGEYTPFQFACISHAFQMGFNSDDFVARIVLDELAGKTTGYNQIPLGSGKVIEASAPGQVERDLILKRLAEMESETGIRAPSVYPALGSPRTQKEIATADLLFRLLKSRFEEPALQQIIAYRPEVLAAELWEYLLDHPQLFAGIAAVIPVISPEGKVYTGPHVMYLNRGVSRPSDLAELADNKRFLEFAALGAVDLRPEEKQVVCNRKVYETGVEVLIKRARFILDSYVEVFSFPLIDRNGSAIGLRTRHWKMLTQETQTQFDPVFFVVQFLGGERLYQ